MNPFFLLIAEDDADDRFILQRLLHEYFPAWHYHFATDGHELLNYLQDRPDHLPPVSLILLDLNMPRKNGLEALTEIRRLPACKNLPVVGFSTSGEPLVIERFIQTGGDKYFQKPVDYMDIRGILSLLPDVKVNCKDLQAG